VRTPRGPLHWQWGQVGIRQDADAALAERVLTEMRRRLGPGTAHLFVDVESDDPDVPPMLLLTMGVEP
jgi:hypothetical protein